MPRINKPLRRPILELRTGGRNCGKTYHMVEEFLKTPLGHSIIVCNTSHEMKRIQDLIFHLLQKDYNHEISLNHELYNYILHIFPKIHPIRGYYKNIFIDDYEIWTPSEKFKFLQDVLPINPNIYFYSSELLYIPYNDIKGDNLVNKFHKITYLDDRNN
jgi:hypothetical protein